MDDKVRDRLNAGVGVAAGYSTYKYLPILVKRPVGETLISSIKNIQGGESDTFYKAAEQAYQNSGLASKGVTLVNVTPDNCQDIGNQILKLRKEILRKEYIKKHGKPPKPLNIPFLNKWLKKQDEKFKEMVKLVGDGKNAFFDPLSKKVCVNSSKMGFSTFHEMGHAINATGEGFRKVLSKIRGPFALYGVSTALLIGLLKRKKEEGEKPKNIIDGATTFIKNNCGAIVGLFMLPLVIEEGVASLNAKKLAKDVLSPEMLKKMNKMNLRAWGTYVVGAGLAAGAAQLAIYVKDRVAARKPKEVPENKNNSAVNVEIAKNKTEEKAYNQL